MSLNDAEPADQTGDKVQDKAGSRIDETTNRTSGTISTLDQNVHSSRAKFENNDQPEDNDSGAEPTYFHYKRWIWVVFPWASMCVKDGLPFSYLIARCFESATRYISVQEEAQLSKDTLSTASTFKRRVNVLLYLSEQKTKLKLSEQTSLQATESRLDEVALKKKNSVGKREIMNNRDIHKIVKEYHQKRIERIQKSSRVIDEMNETKNNSNNFGTSIARDTERADQNFSRVFTRSKDHDSSRQFLRKHKRVVSETEQMDIDSFRMDKTRDSQGTKTKFPSLKLETISKRDTPSRRKSIAARIRDFSESRGLHGSFDNLTSRTRGLSSGMQQQLDASIRKLSLAKQKVDLFHQSVATLKCNLKSRDRVSDGLAILNSYGSSISTFEEKVLRKTVEAKIATYNQLAKQK